MSSWKQWFKKKEDPIEVLLDELIKAFILVTILHAYVYSDKDGPITSKDRASMRENFFDCVTLYILNDNTILTCFNYSPGMSILPGTTRVLNHHGNFEVVNDFKKFDAIKTCFQIIDPLIQSTIKAEAQLIELNGSSKISIESIKSIVDLAHISIMGLIGRV